MNKIALIIPAYEPDERLIDLLNALRERRMAQEASVLEIPIYLVNDGSGLDYNAIFEKATVDVEETGGCVLTHEVNRGKGRALKTAFEYILRKDPDIQGVVTADSDGQHSPECIEKIVKAMVEKPNDLILGVRKFSGDDVPWKSRFGNAITEKVFSYVSGVHVTDTQTGLRGIPASFMRELLDVKGERFEFEMRMLLESAYKYQITEVPIETIYDSKDNHQTHFNPLKDSIRIYRILLEKFVKFLFSSVSSCVLDLVLFAVFCSVFKKQYALYYAGMATVAARVISAVYNYILNYKIVFKSKVNVIEASIKYFLLAVVQMTCSALAISLVLNLIPSGPEIIFKIIIDSLLFLISFKIQQRFVFR